MNLSAPFIRRPIMTCFVMLAIMLAGYLSFLKLPVSDLPSIERPHIQVVAGYSGASPEKVLNQVTMPLEEELSHVKGLQEISSTSSLGYSTITLSFDLNKEMAQAASDTQAALNRAEAHLPREMSPRPTYSLHQDSQEPILYLSLSSDHLSVAELRSFADSYIIPPLSRLEGVAQVLAFGAPQSVWIRLNPEMMALRQIGFNQVIDAVRERTSQMPMGTIQTSSKQLAIELQGTLQRAKELEELHIGSSGLKLKEIAHIIEKSANEQKFHVITRNNTSQALILRIQKVSDGNTVAISKAIQGALKAIEGEIPKSIKLGIWFDKAVWIKESIHDVELSLLFAFILVVIVIYCCLGRLSQALITSMALPLSLIGTFIAMHFLHFSLDLLSMLALTLSVGFVVDDAIVVLENIVRCQEMGLSPRQASLRGSKQIAFTIVSMTLSLVAIFIPLLFMSGLNGVLLREFSVTLAVAILVSGFISLTLTPMLCSRFLRHAAPTPLQNSIARTQNHLLAIYGRSLKAAFAKPGLLMTLAAGCTAATALLFSQLPVNLVPSEDRGFLFAFTNLPPGLEPAQVTQMQTRLEEVVSANAHFEECLSLSFSDNTLLQVVRLTPLNKRPPQSAVMQQLQKEMDKIPGIQTFIHPYQLINLGMNFGHGGQYEMIVRGRAFADVEAAAAAITARMQTHAEFSSVRSSLTSDAPSLCVELNEEAAHKLRLSREQIQLLLQQAYGQISVGSIQRGSGQEAIYMELLPHYQNYTDALSKLSITSRDGYFIPLKSLVTWKERLAAPSLNRREKLPATSLYFSLKEDVAPSVGIELARQVATSLLPEGVSLMMDGSAKAINETMSSTLLLLLAAAIVMYIVLGILYESFIHPLTILSSIPFAGLGGVLTLMLFREPISLFSAVGFLLLIGIVKKNGIMMVDYAIELQGKDRPESLETKGLEPEAHNPTIPTQSPIENHACEVYGENLASEYGSAEPNKRESYLPEEAIYEACLVRFRPIMMTTIAAIMGALPLAIGLGESADMLRGLGLVIVGGLLFSQLLTLYVTPIIYLQLARFEIYWLQRRLRRP